MRPKITAQTNVIRNPFFKFKAVATGNKGPHQNVPTTPVTINSATLVK